jgi:hypothetical protein
MNDHFGYFFLVIAAVTVFCLAMTIRDCNIRQEMINDPGVQIDDKFVKDRLKSADLDDWLRAHPDINIIDVYLKGEFLVVVYN